MLPSKYGCVDGWDDDIHIPVKAIKEYMDTLDEAYLSSLGSNPHDLIVKVHQQFVLPWGGAAT